jgi:peroxiredoxin
MLHFFSSWCGECSTGAASVANVHNSFKDSGFSVVGVAVEDDPFQTQIFAAKNSLHFPIFMDAAGDLKAFFGVKTVPATIFLDQNGTPITFLDPASGKRTAKFDGARMWDTAKPVEMIAALVERKWRATAF